MPWQNLGIWLVLLSSALFCAAADLPVARNFEGRPIASIRFDPENQPLTPDEIERALSLKPGMPFRVAELRSTIKQLYATGRYERIEADGEPAAGGVAVVFRTTNRWFISRVESDPAIKRPPTPGQVTAVSRLDLGQPFHEDQLQEASQRVLALLKRNGYYEARVEPVLSRDPTHQEVNIRFSVEPGKRARFQTPIIIGEPEMPPGAVVAATKWKRFWFLGWKPATSETVQNGIQNVRKKYEKEDRLMASISLEKMDYDSATRRVTPTLKVVGGPKVELRTEGAKISGRKKREYIPLYDVGAMDRDLLVQGVRNLRDYFQIQGYFDARVSYEENQITADHEVITYTIHPGPRRKLEKVEIQGNHYFDTATIAERMLIQPAGLLRLRHGRYSQALARRDENAIKALYNSNGFRDTKVEFEPIANFQGHPDQMAVIVKIDEGPQYLVSDFSISGIRQLNEQDIVAHISSAAGEPFSEINVASDRNYIIQRYHDAGFPDASFMWSAKPGPQPNTVSVHYTVTERGRRYVRDVLLSGMDTTSPRLIGPALHIQKGDPLSLPAMSATQENIYNLGVFDQVNMAVQNPDGDTERKYVLFQLQEGHRYQLATGFGAEVARIGGGQNSLANPAGAAGFTPRGSVDLSRLNMWGLGHTLNFKGRLSTLDRLASLNYYAPRYRNVEGRNITVTGLWERSLNVRTFSAHRLEGSTQLSQKLSKASTMLYRFTYRRVSVDASTLKIEPLLIPLLSQPVRIGILSANYVLDRRDNSADAHSGIYNTVDLGVAANVFGSKRNFGKLLETNSTYHPLGKNLVLARRLEIGWLAPFALQAGLADAEAIPLPERFFGGGGTSHRGFPDNQAGPRDPLTGFPLGGNALLFHNTELRFPLVGDNISGVLFHDMGNIYSTISKISFRIHQRDMADFNYMVHAVGFGIRYRTPVGPVRVDLAYSINPPAFMGLKGTPEELLFGTAPRVPQSINHFQFFFSIGQAF